MNYLATYDTKILMEMMTRHREQYLAIVKTGSEEDLERCKILVDRLAAEIKRRSEKEMEAGSDSGEK